MTVTALALDQLPGNGIELIGLAIITLGGVISLRMQAQITNRKIAEMHEQVRNDHPKQPNLRHDLDETRDATVVTRDMTVDMYAILRDVQDRQIAQDQRLTAMGINITGARSDITGVSLELHDERQRSITVDEQLWRAILDRLPKPPG